LDRRSLNLLEKVKRLVEAVNASVDAVLVEGARDERAVKGLGLTRPVYRVAGKRVKASLVYEVSAKLKGCRVLVLTDFDEEGERLNQLLAVHLSKMGVAVEEGLRRRFNELLVEAGLREVEELAVLFKSSWPPP